MKLTLQPLLYPLPCSPRRIKSLNSPFVALLFSWSYKLLFPQPLSFDGHLRCPGVWGPHFIPSSRSQVHRRQHVYSQWITASCILLPLFFEFPFFVFSNLRTLFAKCRGGGGTPSTSQVSRRSNSGDQDLQIVYPSPNPLDVPTFRHSAKIQPTSL